MGKKGGRRKRLRTDRQARAARQRAVRERVASQRQELIEEAVRLARERMERMCDPKTPVEELADLLADQYDGGPVPAGIAELLRKKGSSPERLVSAAEVMLAADCADGGSPSVTALTFRAAAARLAKDTGQARDFLDQALATAGHDDDPDALVEMIDHLHQCGHLADAIEMFEARMREAPEDTHAAGHYGAAIAEAWARVTGGEPVGECPCGAGRPWQDCCGPRERAAVGRFGDRSGLTALREAVAAYLPGSGYGQAVDDEVAEYLSLAEDTDWEPAERSALADLVAELGLVTAGADGADDPGPGQEEDSGNVLTAFAAGPAVPAELAARARSWRDHIHYGLWRIDNPDPAPGVWCTDIVSGATRYVEFPPAAAERLARWMVWAGAVVPVDGIWRSSGLGVPLSPAEADAAAEVVQASTEAIVGELAGKGKKGATRRAAQPMPFGHAQPHGVLIDLSEPASPEVTRFIGMITAAVLARIAVEVHDHRVAPPALSNTDGDPMCLITARITVRDAGNGDAAAGGAEAGNGDGGGAGGGGGEAIARLLAGHPDFDRDPDDPAQLSWLGLEMPEGQRAAMMAEARAQLAASGQHAAKLEEPHGPQRWVRGQIRIEAGGLVAEVNSRERLQRLLGLLGELGVTATVTDEKRVDPALDLAWQSGPRAFTGGAAPAAEGWEKHWLDEPVPALGGRTPRQAARSKDSARLEALLRQFEYEADLLAAGGKTGVDTTWLRQELDMDGFG
jgi:hypothetical protein